MPQHEDKQLTGSYGIIGSELYGVIGSESHGVIGSKLYGTIIEVLMWYYSVMKIVRWSSVQ